jgi:hypothetical protein
VAFTVRVPTPGSDLMYGFCGVRYPTDTYVEVRKQGRAGPDASGALIGDEPGVTADGGDVMRPCLQGYPRNIP